ncbi:MAG: hypothetical protein Q8O82_09415 [Pseudorhodobacter sp.]|nr:hypothetical protein [Pseudorhodobacter sp.]
MNDGKTSNGQTNSKPGKPMVLLSADRSGTNFLISKLLMTKQVLFGWEPFNKRFKGHDLPGHFSIQQDVISRLNSPDFRDRDSEGYISYCAGLTGALDGTGVKLSGFKIFPAHNSDVYWKMTRDTRFRALVLERRSVLAVYSSLKIASKTNVWVIKKTNKPLEDQEQIKTVFVPKEFIKFAAAYRDGFKETIANLQQAGVDYKHVYYEDLVRDPACFASILNFLEIESNDIGESFLTKQNDPNILNRFSNPEAALPYLKQEQREEANRKRRMQVSSKPKKIFIHIGKPRTATTSFQTGICSAADKLKEAGLCVPKSGRAGDRHMQLVWASSPETVEKLHPWHRNNYDGRSVEDHVEMIMDEAQDQPAILLSSEWFSIFPDLCFSRMVDAFSRHGEVTALVALRDQADTVYSSFMQQLQAKSLVPPFERFGLSSAEYGKSDAPLDHHVLLRNWSGMCRVRAFWFGPQICERIMAETGFPDIAEFSRENSSVPFELSGFVRAEAEKPYKLAEWNAFIEAIRKDPVQFAEHADPALLTTADAIRRRISDQFAESNARLETDFGHLFS